MQCAHIDYCEYVCKVMLFEEIKAKECTPKCDASSFHGRYPDALAWMQKKKEKEQSGEEL
jgi:ribosomal protein L24E